MGRWTWIWSDYSGRPLAALPRALPSDHGRRIWTHNTGRGWAALRRRPWRKCRPRDLYSSPSCRAGRFRVPGKVRLGWLFIDKGNCWLIRLNVVLWNLLFYPHTHQVITISPIIWNLKYGTCMVDITYIYKFFYIKKTSLIPRWCVNIMLTIFILPASL